MSADGAAGAAPPDTGRDETVREDFDEIARALERLDADVLEPYEEALLDLVPARGAHVLEVGCGHGALARRLARRAATVTGIDVSPEMIRVARARSGAHPNVQFHVADVTTMPLPAEQYDVVISAATLHHLPFEPTVRRLAAALRPGGRLIVQDLVDRSHWSYAAVNALGLSVRLLRRIGKILFRQPRGRHGQREVAALYAAHGRGERYLTPRDAAAAFSRVLPGTRVTHHLEWRYTAVWVKPEGR